MSTKRKIVLVVLVIVVILVALDIYLQSGFPVSRSAMRAGSVSEASPTRLGIVTPGLVPGISLRRIQNMRNGMTGTSPTMTRLAHRRPRP